MVKPGIVRMFNICHKPTLRWHRNTSLIGTAFTEVIIQNGNLTELDIDYGSSVFRNEILAVSSTGVKFAGGCLLVYFVFT